MAPVKKKKGHKSARSHTSNIVITRNHINWKINVPKQQNHCQSEVSGPWRILINCQLFAQFYYLFFGLKTQDSPKTIIYKKKRHKATHTDIWFKIKTMNKWTKLMVHIFGAIIKLCKIYILSFVQSGTTWLMDPSISLQIISILSIHWANYVEN